MWPINPEVKNQNHKQWTKPRWGQSVKYFNELLADLPKANVNSDCKVINPSTMFLLVCTAVLWAGVLMDLGRLSYDGISRQTDALLKPVLM